MQAARSINAPTGVVVGCGAVLIVTGACALVGPSLPHSIPAMLLLIPIVASSVLTTRWVSVLVATFAAAVFGLAFIPPIGALRIGLTEDVFVFVTFVVVALVVGVLAGVRRAKPDDELLDQRRAVLLRGVSHDLRTPLTTITAISTDLLNGGTEYDETTRTELLARVVDESGRLNRIVGNLLSVTRVQAGALVPTLEPESLGHLVQHSIGRLNREHAHSIIVDVPADLPDVMVDCVQIDQVLTNLVENALRYTPARSVVEIRARRAGAARRNIQDNGATGIIEVTVSDDGPGFPPAVLADPFQPFRRRGSPPAGFGLSVCLAIVEAHGGTIAVHDSSTGGAAIRFSLPIARPLSEDLADRG